MLIIALVLAVIGLAALVAAVVTSNELIAWVCIGASVVGVLLLIADALRARRGGADDAADDDDQADVVDGSEETAVFAATTDDQDTQDYPEDLPVTEPEGEAAGVTDTGDADTDSDTGGAVEISPDPEVPPSKD